MDATGRTTLNWERATAGSLQAPGIVPFVVCEASKASMPSHSLGGTVLQAGSGLAWDGKIAAPSTANLHDSILVYTGSGRVAPSPGGHTPALLNSRNRR